MKISEKNLFDSEIIHTFLYYDRPLFFIKKLRDGQLLLQYFIDEEREFKTETWFACYITERELHSLMSLQRGVLDFLKTKIQCGEMYYQFFLYEEEKWVVSFELIGEQNLDEEALPSEEFYIEYDYKNNKELTEE